MRIVTYSILVNGEPHGIIHPTRGIKQGDPLSLFLFMLCTEGLQGLIKHAIHTGDIKGFSLCWRGLELTHLLFADDSLLFCKATPKECEKIVGILNHYKEDLGQKVNINKTVIFFITSTQESTREEIKSVLGLQEITQYEKYLGLPTLVGRKKKKKKKKASILSRKKYGGSCKVGRVGYCLKQDERS